MLSEALAAGPRPDGGARSGRTPVRSLLFRPARPLQLLAPWTAGVVLLLAAGPVNDIDSYWHVLIGDQIRRQRSFAGLGSTWSMYRPAPGWQTSQWLSEVLFSVAHQAMGWGGLLVLRTVAAALTLVLLAGLLDRGPDHAAAAGVVYAATAIGLLGFLQTRPQTFSWPFVVLLAGWAWQALRSGRFPRWWVLGLVSCLWAQLHGLWVLLPGAFAVVLCLRVAAAGRAWRAAGPQVVDGCLAVVAGLVGGCLSPDGVGGLVLPFSLHAAAPAIAEWRPTEPWSPLFLGMAALVAFTVASWARSVTRPPWWELAYAGFWTAFGLSAWRSLGPAMVMLAPVAVDAAVRARAEPSGPPVTASARERRLWRVAAVVVPALLVAMSVLRLALVDPLQDTRPLQIARYLAAHSSTAAPARVWNDYNAGGVLLAFGGPHLQVVVDGRADRYGRAYIAAIIAAEKTEPGWQAEVGRFSPAWAVLPTASALAGALVDEQHWTRTMTDHTWSLLAAPVG